MYRLVAFVLGFGLVMYVSLKHPAEWFEHLRLYARYNLRTMKKMALCSALLGLFSFAVSPSVVHIRYLLDVLEFTQVYFFSLALAFVSGLVAGAGVVLLARRPRLGTVIIGYSDGRIVERRETPEERELRKDQEKRESFYRSFMKRLFG